MKKVIPSFFHVDTQNQLVDNLKKPLDQATFAWLRGQLGMCFPY